MTLRLLLDEMVEHEVLHRLERHRHDVEHVDLHDELSKGDPDCALADYSLTAERIIVIYDDDWVEQLSESDYHCVLLFDDATLSAKQVAQVVHNMSTAYPESAFEGLQKTGRNWL